MLTVLTVHALKNCWILPTTYYVQSSEFIRQSSSAGLQLEFNLLRFSFFSRRLRYYGEDKSWINFGRNRTHIPYNLYRIFVVVVHWREKWVSLPWENNLKQVTAKMRPVKTVSISTWRGGSCRPMRGDECCPLLETYYAMVNKRRLSVHYIASSCGQIK